MKMLFVAALLLTSPVLAHEGHELPGQLKATHGGLIKTGKQMNMEMVYTGDTVRFYPQPHPGETIDMAQVKLSGSSKTPKGKPQTLSFTSDGKSFSTRVDLQGSYRADLDIKVDYENKIDQFKFLVEK